ncbi:MAG: LruC domain-containing protein [Cellulophaga sp.]
MIVFNRLLGIFCLIIGIINLACSKDISDTPNEKESETPIDEFKITDLKIPKNFKFKTHNEITITINDNTSNTRYDVYAYNDKITIGEEIAIVNDEGLADTTTEFQSDILNHILFTGAPTNGVLTHTVAVPSYYTKLYVRRKEGTRYSSKIITINNDNATYTHINSNKRSTGKNILVEDFLFCVNGAAELFQINPLDGVLTYLSDMPMGSYTCAIDQSNHLLYSIGKSNPYPLMKYDIINDSWETVGNVGKGGPRLEYNESNGLLYFSTGSKLYTIDPTNATIISTWNIIGLHNTSGGDLAFASDGTLFLCSFSGLYRLELDEDNNYQSTRISADNLPFNPTSMTFDSNQELWLANSASSSNLIIMDTQTGGWQYNYGPQADNEVDFGRTINDLTTYRITNENVVDPDSDGDGITDSNDKYPDDANKAFEVFTPSKYGTGTIAFEDLWPFLGDYDFNDVAVNYRIIAVLNSENKAVQVDFNIEVTSNGAGFVNGFGIELENLEPSQVASITGQVLTQNYINLNANGTEQGQDNVVVILYDNNITMLNKPTTISVVFTTPITTEELGIAPFNPFIIRNSIREHEVHLPTRPATTLASSSIIVEGTNHDADGNYKTDSGLPWAINIIHNFRVPKEKVPVNEAYNFFNQWATSGGTSFPDWYKDNPGYRNSSKLETNLQ